MEKLKKVALCLLALAWVVAMADLGRHLGVF